MYWKLTFVCIFVIVKNWFTKHITGGIIRKYYLDEELVFHPRYPMVYHFTSVREDAYESLWQRIKNKFRKKSKIEITYSAG